MIYTYLDLSTGHLKSETRDMLDQAVELPLAHWPAMTVAKYAYGYFVTVPELGLSDIREQALCLPPDLFACIQHAHLQGIHLLRFDAEGDEVAHLEVFDE